MHSLSKRSNLAGMRVGFYAGDPELVEYLVETRKHAGFMAPVPMQAAAVAALGDDDHVAVQRARYARPAGAARSRRSRRSGSCTTAARASSTSGSAATTAPTTVGRSRRSSRTRPGLLVAPGDLYGPSGADHVRLALVQPDDRFELAFDRLAETSN